MFSSEINLTKGYGGVGCESFTKAFMIPTGPRGSHLRAIRLPLAAPDQAPGRVSGWGLSQLELRLLRKPAFFEADPGSLKISLAAIPIMIIIIIKYTFMVKSPR